ncbi:MULTISPECIES: hypothetical protein [Kosakonia]|jgi:hypothetical protein|uniref:hypothetical protein n=1 Tax=Kosakonia TaxID=1330547 RepID=UPI0021E88FF8|nr:MULTISPECIES: hypothetical protein [Kosakonia]MDY0888637.1 hypothetical protein [Kosakonia sp. CFBP8986]
MYKILHKALNTFTNLYSESEQPEEEVQANKAVRSARELVYGIFTFEDITKEGRRLSIQGHGGIIKNKGYIADAKGNFYDGKALKRLLITSGVDIRRFKKVRLICCRSADSGAPLAQQVANEFNLPTKGYTGSAWGNVRNSMLRAWIDDYDQFTEAQAKRFTGEGNYMHKGVSWRVEGGRKKLIENMPVKFKPQIADIIEDNPGAILNSGLDAR